MPLPQFIPEFIRIVYVGNPFFHRNLLIGVVAGLIGAIYLWQGKMLHQGDFSLVRAGEAKKIALGVAALRNVLRRYGIVGRSFFDAGGSFADVEVARQNVGLEKIHQRERRHAKLSEKVNSGLPSPLIRTAGPYPIYGIKELHGPRNYRGAVKRWACYWLALPSKSSRFRRY